MTWRPLDGVRVLDLSRLLPGPFLTQLLHELGADVVKVEEPRMGDPTRWTPPDVDGVGHAFWATNRGKRSLALDLKADGAADVALRLAARSDVLVSSFRPGVLDRLGLDDARLAAANPRLVRVDLVGYPEGPLRDDAGHDLNYVALSGALDAQGDARAPAMPGTQSADVAGALYAATGILAALHERARNGRGRRIEVALADAALATAPLVWAPALAGGPLPGRGAWPLSGGLPGYNVYACQDGGFVALGALEDKFWARFCRSLGRDDWEARMLDPEARADVATLFATAPRDAWIARLREAGVPATPVLDAREALAHPHASRWGGAPGAASPLTHDAPAGRAPGLGADSEDVLREAGYTRAEVAALKARGALGP